MIMTKCCSTCRWLAPIKTSAFEVGISDAAMKQLCEEQVSRSLPEGADPVLMGRPPVLFGECRFGPPSISSMDGMPATVFPAVGSGDWCGKHEPSMGDAKS